ncbi:hypothetical protein [Streptomyces sp. NPDC056190]|uniref:hypothetical protein n=1 Tax=unclassified Streptomyces TaxID=2593676 RepID=UPI0035D613F4
MARAMKNPVILRRKVLILPITVFLQEQYRQLVGRLDSVLAVDGRSGDDRPPDLVPVPPQFWRT